MKSVFQITYRWFLPLACLLLGFFSITAQAEELSIMSFNIRNGRGLNAPDVDLKRPAEVIRQYSPDIAGLQELDRFSKRCGNRDIPADLGKAVGMKSFFAQAISFQGGAYGVASLAKCEPIRTYHVPLPGKEERRTLQVLEFPTFVFFNTHWSLTKESRLASVEIIEAERKKFTKPIFLCGDFNAFPDSEEIQKLMSTWTVISPDAPTFPANGPKIRIDYVMTTLKKDAIKVESAEVLNAPAASDHAPILVRVRF